MSQYVKTGRPPGRPRKDGSPPKANPDVPAKPEKPSVNQPQVLQRSSAPGYLGPQPAHICPECYPAGWPNGATGLSCSHGVWTRRL